MRDGEWIDGERVPNDEETPCPVCGVPKGCPHGAGCPNSGTCGPWPTAQLMLRHRLDKERVALEAKS